MHVTEGIFGMQFIKFLLILSTIVNKSFISRDFGQTEAEMRRVGSVLISWRYETFQVFIKLQISLTNQVSHSIKF